MTFKFNAIQLGTNPVPVSLIVIEHKITLAHSVFIGLVGNQTALDAVQITENNLDEVFKVFKHYLVVNQIVLVSVSFSREENFDQKIFDAYSSCEHILFER